MSNSYTATVNLTADVATITLGEREGRKLRVADNTYGKNETRFFDVLVTSAPDIATADRLKKGDKIVVTGQLTKTSYRAKKTTKYAKKGATVYADSMPFGRIMEVIKSPSFFNSDGETQSEEGGEPAGSDDAPDTTEVDADDDSDPTADI